ANLVNCFGDNSSTAFSISARLIKEHNGEATRCKDGGKREALLALSRSLPILLPRRTYSPWTCSVRSFFALFSGQQLD
ncbi:MAG: hypothetical protein DME68_04975, partial [Verrucomicrobia bacterium]